LRSVIIAIVFLLFSFSSTFSQTKLIQTIQHKPEIKFNSFNYFLNYQKDKVSANSYSFINLSGQAVVGSASEVVFSILPLAIAWNNALSGKSTPASQTALLILTLASYTFGAAVGVHLIAKIENPNLSLLSTFGYSAIGTGAGIVLASILASQYTTIPVAGGVIIALCPVIGSMLYASFISDWPDDNPAMSFYKNNIAHKNLVDRTKLFNMEILRIRL